MLADRRKTVILATKFGMAMDDAGRRKGGSRPYVMSAVEDSLRRLRTDWIDLYYLHRPDPATPIEETLRALDDLVRQGKVRFAGCSNLSAAELDEAAEGARAKGLTPFTVAQDRYNLLEREIESGVLPAIERHRLALIPYFPLASGLLSGKYRKSQPMPAGTRLSDPQFAGRAGNDFERDLETVERLVAFCTARRRSLIELAFAWLLARPGVASVIAGATSPEQVAQNAGVLGWHLTAAEIAEVNRIVRA
jgi:aryl-alcohol dehydrogenase-like predicted oxidoreductase